MHHTISHSARKWHKSPVVVFAVPLVVLLCFPHVYNMVVPSTSRSHEYNLDQLEQVASLFDDIYQAFADVTFIPHPSIKRGPHRINHTASNCKRDPAVRQLMEILLYVDPFEVQESDWLYGGSFMDYRRQDHLEEGCDPLRQLAFHDYMTPQTIALTSWGTGGWNGDRTWVLLYDTKKHAIRIFEGEEYIGRDRVGQSNGYKIGHASLFHDGIEAYRSVLDRNSFEWEEWFDPSTLLTRIRDAYRSVDASPWATSNKENGWGLDADRITQLIRNNGWPDSFDPDQFNVDFIRESVQIPERGFAQATFDLIQDLEGRETSDGQKEFGSIFYTEDRLSRHRKELGEAKDEDEIWTLKWRIQKDEWTLEDQKSDLQNAKDEYQLSCPNNACLERNDRVLWEFRGLEKQIEKTKYAYNTTYQCQRRIEDIPDWAPPNPERLENCIKQMNQESHWVSLAYSQAKLDALDHCKKTLDTFLPPDSLQSRAEAKLAEFERDLARNAEWQKRVATWYNIIPEHATKAAMEFEMWNSPVVNARWYIRDDVDWIKQQLKDDGDKRRLWNFLEPPQDD
ncbi:hypothetical protein IQ07DRAFT_606121 [Pyrenochaeta sp. DS3sAY3a]|nr:hypothetical protein IQ07DRAFT_606121 [Pyrenochaeta sp. DS3sAY3a]